jgi:hypothetical protein
LREDWQTAVINLWRKCRRYQALPLAGGLVDQDPFLMRCFTALDSLQDEIDAEEIENLTKK